ncbi:MAG: hypothetical protein JWM47_4514 [Acidimicrobiales bacterium]|nr:hypothetical protein [Acidimicrobiales bacterium]
MPEADAGRFPAHDPMMRGLIQSLPPLGTVWPTEKREAWAKLALAIFDQLYED